MKVKRDTLGQVRSDLPPHPLPLFKIMSSQHYGCNQKDIKKCHISLTVERGNLTVRVFVNTLIWIIAADDPLGGLRWYRQPYTWLETIFTETPLHQNETPCTSVKENDRRNEATLKFKLRG